MKNSVFAVLLALAVLSSAGPAFTYPGNGQLAHTLVGPFSKNGFNYLAQLQNGGSQPYVVIRAYQNSVSPPDLDPNFIGTV
jgi:hypothetical protein